MTESSILIVEDDAPQRALLARFLASQGYVVADVGCVDEARAALLANPPALVLTDHELPDGTGLDVLRAARGVDPDLAVVLITAYGTVGIAVEAMREGAADVLLKPVDPPVLLDRLRRSLRLRHLQDENTALRRRLDLLEDDRRPVGDSEAMRTLLQHVKRVAPTDATVLIAGETGTGKEVIARLLHAWGSRPDGPFVTTDCGALTETLLESQLFGHARGAFTGADADRVGRLEAAHGGTLFFDEVAEMPKASQSRLLRVLEAREVVRLGETRPRPIDVRVVAATHRDLATEVRAGRFREDLRYRIEVVALHVPPLRERSEDVPALVEHFASNFARRSAVPALPFSDAALGVLRANPFPGNVRELRNIVERALLLADGAQVEIEDLRGGLGGGGDDAIDAHDASAPPGGLEAAVRSLEVGMIQAALARAGGVQTRAAADLGIAERVLRYKMKKYGIRRDGRDET